MSRLSMAFGLGFIALALVVNVSDSQDKKDKDEKGKKIVGQVPANWTKALNLTKDQQVKIRAIDAEHKTKIQELEMKVAELKQQSRIEMTKVLTDDQKTLLAKLSGLDTKKDDAKKDDKDKSKDKDK